MHLNKTFKEALYSKDLTLAGNEESKGAIPSAITEEEDYSALKEKPKRKRHKIKTSSNGSYVIEEEDFVNRTIM